MRNFTEVMKELEKSGQEDGGVSFGDQAGDLALAQKESDLFKGFILGLAADVYSDLLNHSRRVAWAHQCVLAEKEGRPTPPEPLPQRAGSEDAVIEDADALGMICGHLAFACAAGQLLQQRLDAPESRLIV